ncbi:MAG TPA: hypothetical protein PLQ13_12885 [Candidatus Krumholzibacteria bacterium]|nr:hypothetical protein [Candidatus Krumholzibacteria bacterium]
MNRLTILVLVPLAALLAFWGCDNDTSNDVAGPGGGPTPTDLTCVGCHTSREMLELALGSESGPMVDVAVKADG